MSVRLFSASGMTREQFRLQNRFWEGRAKEQGQWTVEAVLMI